jgi:signal peptidase II
MMFNQTESIDRRSSLRWCWLSLVIILVDQLTKYFAVKFLTLYEPTPVLSFFNLTLLHNTGAAFSFLSNTGSLATWLFSSVALIISVGIIFYLGRLPSRQHWAACALALVLGGALSNLIDRLCYGYVIDFLDFYYSHWHFAAFNVADAAISVGAVMWFIDALCFKKG